VQVICMQAGPTDLTNQLDSTYSMQAVVQMVCMRLCSTDLAKQLHSTNSTQAVVQMVCIQAGPTDLSNQLDNLIEVVLLLQHLTHSLPDVDEVRVKLVIEWLQRLHHHTAGQQTVAFRCQISTMYLYMCNICARICLYICMYTQLSPYVCMYVCMYVSMCT